jgi:hypothetical protein
MGMQRTHSEFGTTVTELRSSKFSQETASPTHSQGSPIKVATTRNYNSLRDG